MPITLHPVQPDFKETQTSLSSASSSTLCPFTDSPSSFYASRTLKVNALGIRALRLPIPSRQREIVVSDDDSEVYVSTRNKRWSGNCILSSSKTGSLIQTDYSFGPNPTILRLLQSPGVISEETKVTGRWTSRSTSFIFRDRDFEWKYVKEKRSDSKEAHLLILQMVNKKDDHCRIAQLVRDKATRTPGTSKCRAGNGGELQIDDAALVECELEESIVVATCLVMLKREVDRRRIVQCAVIAGAVGACS
ncbi:hypothetical protein N7448_001865 [Penicillium atrosanguineum]|uniref:Uncharacterized protein n=1 Tax=Penicillium atrosanguineum TaxID=1132637 RepID=A0A9W9Q5T7_9EURO|nr:uncharacterized protein N7443_005263 [Penicillium atrosanguineum]KAJ5133106.1 hypothetical protein N7526_004471 [Penicillium atrosanguineum]KAJ5150287.1 hypothetical protein N7448_001865 [Penicillium atrosanguineum]KAJ5305603.1 hypothetical protein N7443_005263 [Penicillium atrosanguineum]KAJ5325065.1 hypothetical protein N7476_003665 [Penicillium atrosanguineum]